ncbi:MAG: hypothetical protein KIT72_15350 [Polyangiaceae bacterium]|nr:hypothetical protein [Polyangiaceae bacterium]MCW5791791.1 hypothetical protein [Polyangiaceae bacterium]
MDLPSDDGLRERLDKLKIPLMIGGVLLMIAAGQLTELRPVAARAVVYGVPLLALLYTAAPLVDTHPALRAVGLGLGGASLLLALWVGAGSFTEVSALTTQRLLPKEPSTVELPSGHAELTFAIHGKPKQERAQVVLEARRGEQRERLEHTFTHMEAPRAARGKALPVDSTWRPRVTLGAAGPLTLELMEGEGLSLPLSVEVLPVTSSFVVPVPVLAFGVLGALGVELWALRRGIRARLSAGVAVALAFAVYGPGFVDQRKPFEAVFSLLVVAVGALVSGLVLGGLVARWLAPSRGRG